MEVSENTYFEQAETVRIMFPLTTKTMPKDIVKAYINSYMEFCCVYYQYKYKKIIVINYTDGTYFMNCTEKFSLEWAEEIKKIPTDLKFFQNITERPYRSKEYSEIE